jgi:hypothetical protein
MSGVTCLTVYICVKYVPDLDEVFTARVLATGRIGWWPWWVD